MGSAERRLLKPECISPLMARQCARATLLVGSSPLLGLISLRYSAIASVSQILTSLWVRHGTSIDGESSSSSLRALASSGGMMTSLKSSLANRASSQPRSDHDE